MLAFLFLILAQLAPPPPRPTLPPPFVGTVAVVGEVVYWFDVPTVVVVVDADAARYRWAADRVIVRFAGRPGTWPVDDLLVGDRVVVTRDEAWWYDRPTILVTTRRDPDLRFVLASERVIVRFARSSGRRVVAPTTIPARLRSAAAQLGGPRYAGRESATRTLATAGTAGVRAAAWAEGGRDAEANHRAALAIERAMWGEGR